MFGSQHALHEEQVMKGVKNGQSVVFSPEGCYVTREKITHPEKRLREDMKEKNGLCYLPVKVKTSRSWRRRT